ncbi:hypothetical protein LTR97_001082 [Elasticomyces elasticus]|uniref:F-box domain-containing protein n=1 Tax=Elasticomyces elasticus TaxID=574655 RepID=A0AAN7WHK1_9PEZI|nr:hypothetical protein LTR97_001082 [Elasticomyces elasticus]
MKIGSSNSAQQALLATAELLENIILFLPARGVFNLQCVSQHFHSIVKTSVQLQRKLFLRPELAISTEVLAIKGGKLVLLPNSKHWTPDLEEDKQREPLLARPATMMNDILRTPSIVQPRFHAQPNVLDLMLGRTSGKCLMLDCDSEKFEITSHASWKATYLTDQPCRSARVYAEWNICTNSCVVVGWIGLKNATTDDPHGFTLGSLVNAVCDKVKPEQNYAYYVLSQDRRKKWVRTLHTFNGSRLNLIRKLEKETGEKAVLTYFDIKMRDVVLLSEKEQKEVQALRVKMKDVGGS